MIKDQMLEQIGNFHKLQIDSVSELTFFCNRPLCLSCLPCGSSQDKHTFANSSSSLFRVSVAVSERSELTTPILPRDQSLLILECKRGSHKGTSIKLGQKRFTKK